jgi:hypothetical protein
MESFLPVQILKPMKSKAALFCISLLIIICPSSLLAAQKFGLSKLIGSYSKKSLVETAANHGGSLSFYKSAGADTIRVKAFLIEFDSSHPDNNPLTTGGGLFGVTFDKQENDYYTNHNDTIYRFDHRPHDRTYFQNQLEFVKRYFATVSRSRLAIDYSVFPQTDNLYSVPYQMSYYSPGYKQPSESWDDYYGRKTVGLMKFVKDAISSADKAGVLFQGLHRDAATGAILDSSGHKTVFMLIHAGASFLTDGGNQGSIGRNTPSDMIDVFITRQFFDFYKDTLGLKTSGVKVYNGADSMLIDEMMMCSETSNQDGLNFGIHGIMVNQIARQIGIPDLFSTSSGMTAVGGFCIMDPYGYSAANGFIPPWPSAWVRAFMGWDTPRTVPLGEASRSRLMAVSAAGPLDTTILQVPINDHEYYLIENRQRNLLGDTSVFNWDTTAKGNADTALIDQFSPVNIRSPNVVDAAAGASNVIVSVKNYDIGIPASGILVWHIDENVIRDRINYDLLNADSNFKAVKLEEADGIMDLGIMGRDIFYQPVFDFGGEEDVFPHFTKRIKDSVFVNTMDEFTRPSTHANDGGQTYLSITMDTIPTARRHAETARVYDHWVRNFSDSAFFVSVKWNFLVPGWPKYTVPEKLFEPAVFGSGSLKKLGILSRSGKLYAFSPDTAKVTGSRHAVHPYVNTRGSMLGGTSPRGADTVLSSLIAYDLLDSAYVFPTVINGKLLIPSRQRTLYIATSATDTSISLDTTTPFVAQPSSYLCKLAGNTWAIGCVNGTVELGDIGSFSTATDSIRLASRDSVCALCVLPGLPDNFACVQTNGTISFCSIRSHSVVRSTAIRNGVPPFSIVSGDINRDSLPEIIVSDGRKGLWAYTSDLALAPGWTVPTDSASVRSKLPLNLSSVSLADINQDGYLDVISGDVQGVYAYNYKGAAISGWPSSLDNRFFRGSVDCTPVVVKKAGSPMVIFHSPTGENETFEIDSITGYNKSKGTIVFRRRDGTIDSLLGLTASFIDSALIYGDSLVTPVVLPGAYVDAIDKNGKRPLKTIGANQLYSNWPLSVGGPVGTSPLIDDFDNDNRLNLFAVSQNGFVYRWKLDPAVVGDSVVWQQAGYDNSRPFAYLAALPPLISGQTPPISFYSYPNPTTPNRLTGYDGKTVYFKYKFSGPAQSVRLDIFTLAGLQVASKTGLSGSFPDWNDLPPLSLATYGPGVYRCRLEARISGKKYVQYWKMAVVK